MAKPIYISHEFAPKNWYDGIILLSIDPKVGQDTVKSTGTPVRYTRLTTKTEDLST